MAEALMTAAACLEVEVVFAQAETQHLQRVRVVMGTTAAEAIALAGLAHLWQASPDEYSPLSCFGRLISPETVLCEGDRIEILRPLLADPKERRRQKVKAAAASARRARN